MHQPQLLRIAGALTASLALLAGLPAQAADTPAQASDGAPKAKAATQTAKAKKAAQTECKSTGSSKDDGSNNPNGKKPSGPKCPELAGKVATPSAK
jgi:hypothetical protein